MDMVTAAVAAKDVVAEFDEMEAHHLSILAECLFNTPQAVALLGAVRDGIVELADEIDADDWAREAIDDYSGKRAAVALAAVADRYTETMWVQFVGLAAHNENPAEMGIESAKDMKTAASTCVYMIAERLAYKLSELIGEAVDSWLLEFDADDSDADESDAA